MLEQQRHDCDGGLRDGCDVKKPPKSRNVTIRGKNLNVKLKILNAMMSGNTRGPCARAGGPEGRHLRWWRTPAAFCGREQSIIRTSPPPLLEVGRWSGSVHIRNPDPSDGSSSRSFSAVENGAILTSRPPPVFSPNDPS